MKFLTLIIAVIFLCAAAPLPPEKLPSEEQLKILENSFEDVRDKTKSLGRKIQKNEQKLEDINKKIAELAAEEKELEEKLDKEQKQIAALISGLQKMRRMPPEALFLRPGNPEDTTRSAMLLSHMVPSIQQRAEDLQIQISHLQDLKDALTRQRDAAKNTSQTLEIEEKELNIALDKRKQLFKKTQRDYKQKQKRAQDVAKKAKSVQDLVNTLKPVLTRPDIDKEDRRIETAAQHHKPVLTRAEPVMPSAGSPRPPLPGVVTVRYNDMDAFGAPSRGIEIRGPSQALIVAPMGGIIRFAGPFKNHGNMVIIEHKNGYHSLVAGFQKIDTLVGQVVEAGEPLGRLGRSNGGVNPKLYFELRHKGKPINPSKKISGIG